MPVAPGSFTERELKYAGRPPGAVIQEVRGRGTAVRQAYVAANSGTGLQCLGRDRVLVSRRGGEPVEVPLTSAGYALFARAADLGLFTSLQGFEARIRRKGGKDLFTVKSPRSGAGIERLEVEAPLAEGAYDALLDERQGVEIVKQRLSLPFIGPEGPLGPSVYGEVDMFSQPEQLGSTAREVLGFDIAIVEFELRTPDEASAMQANWRHQPDWLIDMTSSRALGNVNIAAHPDGALLVLGSVLGMRTVAMESR